MMAVSDLKPTCEIDLYLTATRVLSHLVGFFPSYPLHAGIMSWDCHCGYISSCTLVIVFMRYSSLVESGLNYSSGMHCLIIIYNIMLRPIFPNSSLFSLYYRRQIDCNDCHPANINTCSLLSSICRFLFVLQSCSLYIYLLPVFRGPCLCWALS